MTDEELIARLRLYGSKFHHEFGHNDAADRIEALTAKVKLMDDLDAINGEKIEALEAKLAKAVEALLWCSGSADFNEGGVARKGWLKVCAPLLKGDSHE